MPDAAGRSRSSRSTSTTTTQLGRWLAVRNQVEPRPLTVAGFRAELTAASSSTSSCSPSGTDATSAAAGRRLGRDPRRVLRDVHRGLGPAGRTDARASARPSPTGWWPSRATTAWPTAASSVVDGDDDSHPVRRPLRADRVQPRPDRVPRPDRGPRLASSPPLPAGVDPDHARRAARPAPSAVYELDVARPAGGPERWPASPTPVVRGVERADDRRPGLPPRPVGHRRSATTASSARSRCTTTPRARRSSA